MGRERPDLQEHPQAGRAEKLSQRAEVAAHDVLHGEVVMATALLEVPGEADEAPGFNGLQLGLHALHVGGQGQPLPVVEDKMVAGVDALEIETVASRNAQRGEFPLEEARHDE
jgi:hypothetical protein